MWNTVLEYKPINQSLSPTSTKYKFRHNFIDNSGTEGRRTKFKRT